MNRIPEPELMNDPAQAAAYAAADFEAPHNHFIELFAACFPGERVTGRVLDLGCGPGDIALRFARAHPGCEVEGVDGAVAMLAAGEARLAASGLAGRVRLRRAYLPDDSLPRAAYHTVISNSLLHHLRDPSTLWQAVRHAAAPGAAVLIMDLRRPDSRPQAEALVADYAAGEPPVLQRDFFHSLLAAYRVEEVVEQLAVAGLPLAVEQVSDRHLLVHGRMP